MRAAGRRAWGRRTGAAAAARRPRASTPRCGSASRSKRAPVAVRLQPGRVAARSRAATAPARSRPAGCRPARASRPGSRARCSGGRRRAARVRPVWSKCRAVPGAEAGEAARRGRAPVGRPARSGGARTVGSITSGRGEPSSTRPDRRHVRDAPRRRCRARPQRAPELLARDHALGQLHEAGRAPCRRPPIARGRASRLRPPGRWMVNASGSTDDGRPRSRRAAPTRALVERGRDAASFGLAAATTLQSGERRLHRLVTACPDR